jgi:phosphoenolpyruvate carboxykinase (GTP)
VNWFRKEPATNAFVWKGFSENSKVLKWIFSNSDRHRPNKNAQSALGEHPRHEDIHVDECDWDKLFSITNSQLAKFGSDVQGFFDGLDLNNKVKVPAFLRNELRDLVKKIGINHE